MRLVIAGAGGFGRGVYSWVADSPRHLQQNNISEIVFIDDNQDSTIKSNAQIISTITDYRPNPGDAVICAIGVPLIRAKVVRQLHEVGAYFHTFVDDRAIIGHRSTIGVGTVICPGAVISADAVIDKHVHVNFNCSVGHDTVLGQFTTLSPAVNIMGEVSVGESVFFGGSSVALPRLNIGAGAIIGAGSVVTRNVVAGTTVKGSPAK